MWRWVGGSKSWNSGQESELCGEELMMCSPPHVNLWRSPPQTKSPGRLLFFNIHRSAKPLRFVKKPGLQIYQGTWLADLPVTPTLATLQGGPVVVFPTPSIPVSRSPHGRCCCQPNRPQTRSALGPWLFGTPGQEEKRKWSKKARKKYVHRRYSKGPFGYLPVKCRVHH